jgi:ring-1,2-phenylacetyl-CoA epoxidase subunit PaaE
VATHFHTVKVRHIKNETADCISVAFEIPDEQKKLFAYKAGQNLTVRTVVDGIEIRRSYSLCSSPLEKEWRIAIKKIPGGAFSGFAHGILKAGHPLEIMPPTGNFHTPLHAAHKKNYLAFAAGSGITPVISLIKTALVTEPQSSFTLVYGNRTLGSIIFREELEAIKNEFLERFTVIYVLSRTKTDAAINQGRIDAGKCELIFGHVLALESVDEFFLCGPAEMIFTVRDWLEEHGVENRKIHFELFNVPASPAKQIIPGVSESFQGEKSQVTIRLDGIRFSFHLAYQGDAILDAALAQGADLPFACKGGVCATCRAKLIEGKVSMDSNYALEKEELDRGFILTCQSHPRTEKVVVDFDIR